VAEAIPKSATRCPPLSTTGIDRNRQCSRVEHCAGQNNVPRWNIIKERPRVLVGGDGRAFIEQPRFSSCLETLRPGAATAAACTTSRSWPPTRRSVRRGQEALEWALGNLRHEGRALGRTRQCSRVERQSRAAGLTAPIRRRSSVFSDAREAFASSSFRSSNHIRRSTVP
jgi:hypothetical protein